MKSPKQRRQEIKERRAKQAARKIRCVEDRPIYRPIGTEPVTPSLLRPNNSYGVPDFVRRGYYQDYLFRCRDCGKHETWTAAQQRWWYEEAHGDVWTVAVRCRSCRQQERTRKMEARRVHLEGVAKKIQNQGTVAVGLKP